MTPQYTFEKVSLVLVATFIMLLTASNSHAHSGSLNKVAMQVCAEKVKSQVCHYEGGHSDLYIGTCQLISDTDLICVRNKPIQKIEGITSESEIDHNTNINLN